MRRAVALPLALVLLVLSHVAAYAEVPVDRGTVNVGPMTSGGVVTEGVAAYDPSGTQATADSRGSPPAPTPAVPGGGSEYTYRPLPYSQVPIAPPLAVNNAGVINVP